MENGSFYQLLDLEKLNDYISKDSKKSVRTVLFLLGITTGIIAPVLEINLESIKRGLLAGLIIGFLWVALKFKESGRDGIVETQKEIFVAFVYLAYFLIGIFGGHYLVKPILEYLVPESPITRR